VDNKKPFRGRLTRIVAAIAKKLLPGIVLREIRQYRWYKKDDRPLYLKIRISNRLGFTNPKLARVPKAAQAILFVCSGNIMRSPMCEALLHRELAKFGIPDITVTSAGLNAVSDWPAHIWAVTAARELGISLEGHRARLLTPEMVDQAEVIFVMDYQNQVQLLSRWAHAKRKVFLLSAYASPDYRPVEIADPYSLGLEGTRRCYDILHACVQNLVRGLLNKEQGLAYSATPISPASGRKPTIS
jgi:protein-tyrosine phosphatase